MFVVAYPRETQEMVLDAHSKAFDYFGGGTKSARIEQLASAGFTDQAYNLILVGSTGTGLSRWVRVTD